MSLTEQQKSSIRRHLRYGNIGLAANTPGGGTLGANGGMLFFGEASQLELRLNSLQPVDEAVVTGAFFASICMQGIDPVVGNQLQLQFSGGGLVSARTVTITAAGETRDLFAGRIASACAQDSVLSAARIIALCPSGGTRPSNSNLLSEVQFLAQSQFTIAILSQTGSIGAAITEPGGRTDTYQTIGGANVYGLLPICNALYAALGKANDRMGVDKADVFTARKSEAKDRRQAYEFAVRDLAQFLVSDINPRAMGRPSNIGTL